MNPVAKITLRGVTAAAPIVGGVAASRLAGPGIVGAPTARGDSFGLSPARALAVQSFAHNHHLGALAASNVSLAQHRNIMAILAKTQG
jgi:hypothetical protein